MLRLGEMQDLKAPQKLLILILASYANDDSECWPSQATLAKIAGMTPKTVRSNLKVLQEKGYITSTQRIDKAGDLATNLYEVNVVPLEPSKPKVVPFERPRPQTTEEKLTDRSWAE